MFIIKYRKIWYTISLLLVIVSLFAIFNYGLNWGIDFKGGSLLEVEYTDSFPGLDVLRKNVSELDFGNVVLQPTGEKGLIIRLRSLSEEEHHALKEVLSVEGALTELRFDSIGPTIGKELREKSWIAVFLVLIIIILYIAFVFRGVSRPVSSFKYGLMAVVALFHDMMIPIGVFAFLGQRYGAEIDVLFITAMLTIFGLSINDTIVVFDRLRENLRRNKGNDFEETVGISINETLTRSINTSLTTLAVLISLFLFGGETTKYFALALIIGMTAGIYSSIFLASPLLVTLYKLQGQKKRR